MREKQNNLALQAQAPEHNKQTLLRLERVSDGIFLLAMMLMVLQFDLPDIEGQLSAGQLREFLLSQLAALSIYFGTFILIAFYWLSNLHQFKFYQKTDYIHTWLNLLSLMFVVLIPYTNDLSSLYPVNSDVQIFYSINLFLVGILSCLSWWYGTIDNRLVNEDLDKRAIQYISIESLIEPLLCLLSIGVSSIAPSYWEWTFFLIIPAYLLLNLWEKQRTLS